MSASQSFTTTNRVPADMEKDSRPPLPLIIGRVARPVNLACWRLVSSRERRSRARPLRDHWSRLYRGGLPSVWVAVQQ